MRLVSARATKTDTRRGGVSCVVTHDSVRRKLAPPANFGHTRPPAARSCDTEFRMLKGSRPGSLGSASLLRLPIRSAGSFCLYRSRRGHPRGSVRSGRRRRTRPETSPAASRQPPQPGDASPRRIAVSSTTAATGSSFPYRGILGPWNQPKLGMLAKESAQVLDTGGGEATLVITVSLNRFRARCKWEESANRRM